MERSNMRFMLWMLFDRRSDPVRPCPPAILLLIPSGIAYFREKIFHTGLVSAKNLSVQGTWIPFDKNIAKVEYDGIYGANRLGLGV